MRANLPSNDPNAAGGFGDQGAVNREQRQFRQAAGQQESPFTRNGAIPNTNAADTIGTPLLAEGPRYHGLPSETELRTTRETFQRPDARRFTGSPELANGGGIMDAYRNPGVARTADNMLLGPGDRATARLMLPEGARFPTFSATPAGDLVSGMVLGQPVGTGAIADRYARSGQIAGTTGQRFADLQARTAASGIERGNRIIGNFKEQTPFGELLAKGSVNGRQIFTPLLPFSSFHIHTTQFWASYVLEHPATPFAIARLVNGVGFNDTGGRQTPAGYLSGALELSTAAKLAHWAENMYRYAIDAIRNTDGNNPLQTAAKIVAYGTVGNNAFINPFEPYKSMAQGAVASATSPMLAIDPKTGMPKRDYETGMPVTDPRELMKEQGSPNFTSSLAQLGNDAVGNLTGHQLPRNAAHTIGNPAQPTTNFLANQAVNLVDKLGGNANRVGYEAAKGIPYMADTFAQSRGWDARQAKAAVTDAMTKNPQTPDGKALFAAYNKQQDLAGLAKGLPVQLTKESGQPIYPTAPETPHFLERYTRGEGGRPGANDFGVYETALRQMEQTGNFALNDYARDYLGKTGVYDAKMGSNISEHRTQTAQQVQDANVAKGAFETGTYLNPKDRAALQDYTNAKAAYEGRPSAAGSDITVKELLGQPGNYNDTIGKAVARQQAGDKEGAQRLFDVAADLKNQTPATRDYFAAIDTAGKRDQIDRLTIRKDDAAMNPDFQRQVAPLNRVGEEYLNPKTGERVQPGVYTKADGSIGYFGAPQARDQGSNSVKEARQYYDQWGQGQRDTFDAFNDLRNSPDYKSRNVLEQQQAGIIEKFGVNSKAYRDWHQANGRELSRLTGVVQAGEQLIYDRTGQNPKAIANERTNLIGGEHPYKDTTIKGEFYDKLDVNGRRAADAMSELKNSPDYYRRQQLEADSAAAGPFGSPGEKAWYQQHGAELVALNNKVTAAERAILGQTGVNVKQLANQEALAAGRSPVYTDTSIKATDSVFHPSGGGSGGSSSTRSGSSSSARSTTSRGSGGGSPASQAGNDFFAYEKSITNKSERQALFSALDHAGVNPVGQKGVSAAEFTRALDIAKAAVETHRSGAQPSATGQRGNAANTVGQLVDFNNQAVKTSGYTGGLADLRRMEQVAARGAQLRAQGLDPLQALYESYGVPQGAAASPRILPRGHPPRSPRHTRPRAGCRGVAQQPVAAHRRLLRAVTESNISQNSKFS